MMKRTAMAAAVLCTGTSHFRRVSAFIAVSPPTTLHITSSSSSITKTTARGCDRHHLAVARGNALAGVAKRQPAHTARAAAGNGVGEGNIDITVDPNAKPIEDFGSGITPDPKKVAVLFDFDGTIGDTETPAMEVAYWELAPYFPGAAGGVLICASVDMIVCVVDLV